MGIPIMLCADVRMLTRPVLGIMTRPRVVNGLFVGKQGPVLLKYLQTAKQERISCCVFDPTALDVRRNRIRAWVLASTGGKTQSAAQVELADLPIPTVIYDQIVSRKFEKSEAVEEAKAHLRRYAIIFNDGYFDKWEVHSWLATEPVLRTHLPHTELVSDFASFRTFVRKHAKVFVKPIHGSLGIGITRIERQLSGFTAVVRVKDGNAEAVLAHTPAELFRAMQKRWLRTPHIMQEGLSLLAMETRPIDIRAIMQKDREGQWRRTKLFTRVAADGEFISNLTTGGEAYPIDWLTHADASLPLKKIKREIHKIADAIPPVLERESARTLGELGIDLGIDGAGHLFVIEVNSKPWKTPETEHGSMDLVDLSYQRPLRFALQLANMRDARRETLQ